MYFQLGNILEVNLIGFWFNVNAHGLREQFNLLTTYRVHYQLSETVVARQTDRGDFPGRPIYALYNQKWTIMWFQQQNHRQSQIWCNMNEEEVMIFWNIHTEQNHPSPAPIYGNIMDWFGIHGKVIHWWGV